MDIFYLKPTRYFPFIYCNEFVLYFVFTYVYIQQVSLGYLKRLVKQTIMKLSFLRFYMYIVNLYIFCFILMHVFLLVMITTNLILFLSHVVKIIYIILKVFPHM